MKIGVIGVGAMGREVVHQLLAAKHAVTIWNRSLDGVKELVAEGARTANDVSDALQGEVALSLLFDEAAVQSVLMSAEGLAKSRRGCVHVCMSTLSLAFAKKLKARHAELGLRYVGAPMLGRPEAIAAGRLIIMAGGDKDLLDLVEPCLAATGTVWRLGDDPVHAQAAKLAANFMISGAIEAMAEATAVLEGFGADGSRFMDVMENTLFSAFVYKLYGPLVLGAAPEKPSGLAMPQKDNASFREAAQAIRVGTPLADAVGANLAKAIQMGRSHEDWSTAIAAAVRS
jgi:3-hydroxyisobutyrate dehydrogenase-like beta-hydroxyacid dehydrogenase